MKTVLVIPSLALLCLSLGAAGAHAADGGAAAAPAPAAAPAKIDWANMTVAEKKKYMKSTVLPEMKKAFQAYDAKTYKKFNCATCHGDGATDGKFKMPNAKLPKLPETREGFMALQQKKPDAVKFMGTIVKPKMAALLGMPEWTPDNPKGFGCYQCHTKEEAKK